MAALKNKVNAAVMQGIKFTFGSIDKPISHAISKALPIAHRCLMVSLALRMLPSLLVNGLLLQAFYCVWYHAVREVLFC